VTLEELEVLREMERKNPRTAAMSKIVGKILCNACKQQKSPSTLFDVRKNGSAARARGGAARGG